ncbi:hypothetical protein GOP47_0028539 [Adiantum capillus-veneris]|nr:hypothetical protein GOP47_0028539 [Adiantum capillus-veneris]
MIESFPSAGRALTIPPRGLSSEKLRYLCDHLRILRKRVTLHGPPCRSRPVCNHLLSGSKYICSKNQPGHTESNGQGAVDDDDDDDWPSMDTSENSLVDSPKTSEGSDQGAHHANDSDEDYMKPQPRKERIKKALAKLKKGPDGRFINVLEVTSDINMLIAAYQSLKAKSRPTYLIEDSDDDDSMEGIDLQRFRKLQKRLRNGTYIPEALKEPKKK